MSKLADLSLHDDIQEAKDSLGGSNVLESDAYLVNIDAAYLSTADSGAKALNIIATTQEGKEYRQTFWMTSGTAKGGKHYYEKDGKKHYLPGFQMASDLARLAAGKELAELTDEERIIKLYNKDLKKEAPTPVAMLVELVNQPVYLGIVKQLVNKTEKTDAGYVNTAETREVNDVVKIFRAEDTLTVTEVQAGGSDDPFFNGWVEKYKGTVQNRVKSGGVAGTVGTPAAAANQANKRPTASLFAKKAA